MSTRKAISEAREATNAVVQKFPQIIETLVKEFEILIGKKVKARPSSSDLEKTKRKLRKLGLIVTQFEELSRKALTPRTARKTLELLNRMLQLSIPRIPGNMEPLEYLIQEVKRYSEIPQELKLPEGLDYETKHLQLQDFIFELVSSVDSTQIDTFLQSTYLEHQLVPQFQRAFGKLSLPKELSKIPSKISLRTAECLKLALRDVTADWEALINLVYGLSLLKQGQQPTWTSIRRKTLWKKVTALSQDPRLTPLAKQKWVIVRNSLDHGLAFFDPNKKSIEFPIRTRRISWNISTTCFEGRDIFLANFAMLRVWNFINAAKLQGFEKHIKSLRKLTSQSER